MSMTCNLAAITQVELDELIRHPEGVFDVFFPGDIGLRRPEFCSLDKTWHGLHYILTGTAWNGDPPLSLAILGGTEIGEDTGYGPPRYLVPSEVRAVADGLDGVAQEVLVARHNPDAMNAAEIYPGGWSSSDDNYLLEWLDMLRRFYRDAATKDRAVLICLS